MNPELPLGGSSPDIASVCIIFIYISYLSLSWGTTAVCLNWLKTRRASERLSNTHYSEHLTTSSSSWLNKSKPLKSQNKSMPKFMGQRGIFLPTPWGQIQPTATEMSPPSDKWCSYMLPSPGPLGKHQTGPQSELKLGGDNSIRTMSSLYIIFP